MRARSRTERPLRLHWLQHVPFEGLGCIREWIETRGHSLGCTRLWKAESGFPEPDEIDWLIVMGGPMGVHDESAFPRLAEEKACIRRLLQPGSRHTVLGICLGAQLIAEALGAKVYRNPVPEIGWAPIHAEPAAFQHPLLAGLPGLPGRQAGLAAFHWHFETFDIPPQAERVFSSANCQNQGLVYGDRVIGLQFHLETRLQDAAALVEHGAADLREAGVSGHDLLAESADFSQMHDLMYGLLDRLEASLLSAD